jgi:hypothetical protein
MDLHIFRSTFLEKRVSSIHFIQKHSPLLASAILKKYSETLTILHERKLVKLAEMLKMSALGEPLNVIGDWRQSRSKI